MQGRDCGFISAGCPPVLNEMEKKDELAPLCVKCCIFCGEYYFLLTADQCNRLPDTSSLLPYRWLCKCIMACVI